MIRVDVSDASKEEEEEESPEVALLVHLDWSTELAKIVSCSWAHWSSRIEVDAAAAAAATVDEAAAAAAWRCVSVELLEQGCAS